MSTRPRARSGTSAPATRTRAARASTSSARRTAGRPACAFRGVQPFLWQTSEGSSILHAATFRRAAASGERHRRRRHLHAREVARQRVHLSAAAGPVVAQDDQNLDAEWGLSSFDRRHQLVRQRELSSCRSARTARGCTTAACWRRSLEDWRVTANFTLQSGTPLTPRVHAAPRRDVARGTNGTLRANYNGDAVQLREPDDRSVLQHRAPSRFRRPARSATPSRNMIIGPGSRQLNAQFSRDVRLGGTRVLSIQLNATNLLNIVNYAAVDTNVNSPTFGQVLSVRADAFDAAESAVPVLTRCSLRLSCRRLMSQLPAPSVPLRFASGDAQYAVRALAVPSALRPSSLASRA